MSLARVMQGPSEIDFRFLFITIFISAIAVWHYIDGNLMPDAIFFTVLAVVTFWVSTIGISGEGDIEWEE